MTSTPQADADDRPDPAREAGDPWASLERSCEQALAASRDVLARLEAGAGATDLQPLLTRERDAVDGLCRGIRAFGGRLPAGGAGRRDALAEGLAELARLDEESHRLLARRGVRLKPSARRGTHTGVRKGA